MRGPKRAWKRIVAAATAVTLAAHLVPVIPANATTVSPPLPRIELVDRRTDTTRTFDNRDGTYTLESHFEPIHYPDAATGRWLPIDPSLVATENASGSGVTNRANRFKVFLPDDAASGWVTVEEAGFTVAMRPAGRPLDPRVRDDRRETAQAVKETGSSRRYDAIFEGEADVVYDVTPFGLKETIVLPGPGERAVFSFDLLCPGMVPNVQADGSVSFLDAVSGIAVFNMAAPFMEDSSIDQAGLPAHSDAVTYELSPVALGWRLDVVADKAWLDDPARVYPVMIDPTTYSQGWSYLLADAYVTTAYPNANYGSSTDLKTGRVNSSGTGINRSYLKPDVNALIGTGYRILEAELNAYCYWRAVHSGSCQIALASVTSPWTEGGITWNTKPATAYHTTSAVAEGAWAHWDVTSLVADYVAGSKPPYGFALVAADEAVDLTYWCRFYSREASTGKPYLTVTFTSAPQAAIVAPSVEVPVDPRADAPLRVVFTYDDLMGKTLSAAQIQINDEPLDTGLVWDSGKQATTEPVVSVPAPSGGWQEARYWVRIKVWGEIEAEADPPSGTEAESGWTAWTPFECADITAASDGLGFSPAHPADPVAGGLAVDLVTGRLIGARTDLALGGLGGPLGIGMTYDSAVTTDTGVGRGWAVATPKLEFFGTKAPNPGFEVVVGDQPTGWAVSESGLTSAVTTSSPAWWPHGGERYLVMANASAFFSATVKSPGGTAGTPVYPGQRVSAGAWVATDVDLGATGERGAYLKLYFYDQAGTQVGVASAAPYQAAETVGTDAQTAVWHRVGLEYAAPPGAYFAQVSLEANNVKGRTYWDDVELVTHDFHFTDADGTGRDFALTGAGAYRRDPLEPQLRFERDNAALHAKVFAGAVQLESPKSTDGITTVAAYEEIAWSADGSAYLRYELAKPELLSRISLKFWDWDAALPTRQYTYRIEVSGDDPSEPQPTWTAVTGDESGGSWVEHSFAPRRVTQIRVVALGNSAAGEGGFHVCELEAPVMRLADGAVAFDDDGRLLATADESGNPVVYGYDAEGRVLAVSDGITASPGGYLRQVTANWQQGQLASLGLAGVDSTGSPTVEPAAVTYSYGSDTLTVSRSAEGTAAVAAIVYEYDQQGRISGISDADGVSVTVAYDASGRVSTVTRSAETQPAVTAYAYGQTSTTVTTTAGSENAPPRVVAFDPVIGGRVTSVTLGSGQVQMTTLSTYDEYGQVAVVTDPIGRETRTSSDGKGHVVRLQECDASGTVLRTTRAEYANDHVSVAVDAKGNESAYRYDEAWRLLNAIQVSGDVAGEGADVSGGAYDQWGNRVVLSVPDATAYDLLRNGTFELNPTVTGNGWDGPRTGSVYWYTSGGLYTGAYWLKLCSSTLPVLTSDKVAVRGGTTYSLSAWMTGRGSVWVNEYRADGTYIGQTCIIGSPSGTSGALLRSTGALVTNASAASARVEIRGVADASSALYIDNVRLELSNKSSGDSFVENQSFERVSSSLPVSWSRRDPSLTEAVHGVSSSERVTGVYAAHIGHTPVSTTGYFYSDFLYVDPGESYTVSMSIKTTGSVGGARGIIYFFNSLGQTLSTETTTVSDAPVKGTRDWARYIKQVTVPSGAARMKVAIQHDAGGGDAYFDSVAVTPASGIATAEYDEATHTYAVATTGLTGATTATTYDHRGRVVEGSYDPDGSEAAFTVLQRAYDNADRLTSASAACGITASYAYTDAGRLISVTDPLGRVTTLDYDASGRLVSTVSPEGVHTLVVYDELGRVAQTMAPAESATPTAVASTVEYDALSRVAQTTYLNADGSTYATVVPTYDGASRVASATTSGEVTATASYVYDDLDRVTQAVTTGPAGSVTFATTYDLADLPTSTTLTAFGTPQAVTNTYTKTNEPYSTTGLGVFWQWSSGASGLAGWKSNYASETRVFDVYGRVARTVAASGSGPAVPVYTTAVETRLSYDGHDRIASATVTGVQAYADSYLYDDADRLTSWERTGAGAATVSYSWDDAGNLTGATAGGITTTFVADDDGRLVSATSAGVSTAYTNDAYGRRISKTTGGAITTYTWDAMGHLIQVASAESTSTYAYGATGMREFASVETSEGVTWTKSVWAGGRLLAELDSDGTRLDYLHAPDGTPVAVKVTGGTAPGLYCYHTDAAGSVVAITKAVTGAQTLVATYAYGPFGEQRGSTGTNPIASRNPLRYRGYYTDGATGLYYLPARYYDPNTARFLSKDPAPPVAGDPRSLNAYAYCQGDPVNHDDPSGARHEAGGGARWMSPDAAQQYREGDLENAALTQAAKYGQHLFDEAVRIGIAPLEEWDPWRYRVWAEGAEAMGVSLDLIALGCHISVQFGFVSNYNEGSPMGSLAFGSAPLPSGGASISVFDSHYSSKDIHIVNRDSLMVGTTGSLPVVGPLGPSYSESLVMDRSNLHYLGTTREAGLGCSFYGWNIAGTADISVLSGTLW